MQIERGAEPTAAQAEWVRNMRSIIDRIRPPAKGDQG